MIWVHYNEGLPSKTSSDSYQQRCNQSALPRRILQDWEINDLLILLGALEEHIWILPPNIESYWETLRRELTLWKNVTNKDALRNGILEVWPWKRIWRIRPKKEQPGELNSLCVQGLGKGPTSRAYCTHPYLEFLPKAVYKAWTRDHLVTWQQLYQLIQGSPFFGGLNNLSKLVASHGQQSIGNARHKTISEREVIILDNRCFFCKRNNESVNNLFLHCSVTANIWPLFSLSLASNGSCPIASKITMKVGYSGELMKLSEGSREWSQQQFFQVFLRKGIANALM